MQFPNSIFAAAYVAVLASELVGDKTLYTLGTLSIRYPLMQVGSGAVAAFMMKMLGAILLGRVIHELPPGPVAAFTAGTFFITALVLWRKQPGAETPRETCGQSGRLPVLITFAALFCSEWGDPGQLTAAALVARFNAPVVVWCAAVLALSTKGALALLLGANLRRWVPRELARGISVAVCLLMGMLAFFRVG